MPPNSRHQIICATTQPLLYPANGWQSLQLHFNLTSSFHPIRILISELYPANLLVWNSLALSSPVIWQSTH
jgi:hypothetical protein